MGRRAASLPIPTQPLARCGIATAMMSAAVWLVPAVGGAPELLAKAVVGAIVYALCAWALNASGVRHHGSQVLKTFQARLAA